MTGLPPILLLFGSLNFKDYGVWRRPREGIASLEKAVIVLCTAVQGTLDGMLLWLWWRRGGATSWQGVHGLEILEDGGAENDEDDRGEQQKGDNEGGIRGDGQQTPEPVGRDRRPSHRRNCSLTAASGRCERRVEGWRMPWAVSL